MFLRTLSILWVSLVTIECRALGSHSSLSRTNEIENINGTINLNGNIYENTDLSIAFVVFRHGDRTPDAHELKLFPMGNISKDLFYPYGLGALTNQGKRRAYQLGEYLKKRFKGLLSPLYLPNEISIRSTDFPRTKMTVLTVLSAMYPPRGLEIWNHYLNWQPIPFYTLPLKEDDLNIFGSCPTFHKLEKEVTGKAVEVLNYKNVYNMLRENTGYNITKLADVYFFGNLLRSLESLGAEIPEWVKEIRPLITELVNLELTLEFSTDELKSLSSGVFLGELVNASKAVIAGEDYNKLNLYSAHDITIASILSALGVLKPHQPDYCSSVFLELRKSRHDNKYGVMVSYGAKAGSEPEPLPIPGCGEELICDFDIFSHIVNKFILTRNEFKNKCQT